MPPRIARAHVSVAAPKNARNKNHKRNLDAYSIASHTTQEKRRLPQHRLGEIINDGPHRKRQRVNDDVEEQEKEEAEDDRETGISKRPRKGPGSEKNDDVEQGGDSSGNEWTLGGLAEDDKDSDIDSDEAFAESDEEKFEGFTFRGSQSGRERSTTRKVPIREVDENDVDDINPNELGGRNETGVDEFGEEGVDLATMLDDEDDNEVSGKNEASRDLDEGNTDEDDEEEQDSMSSSNGDQIDDDDDDVGDEERVARLRDRLDALDATHQPSAAATSAPGATSLSVDDLLADLDPATKKQYAAALKTKRKSTAPKTLSAPLPKRQQDRLNREVASKNAKEQLDRWRDTVIQNRRAEFLTFPLVDPTRGDSIGKDKFDTHGAPQTELEANIQRIMEESGITSSKPGQDDGGEDAIIQSEELGTNNLPVEEVLRRRTELRQTRELLFREEIKAKRIAKIKSKAYRRVHRRERKRMQALDDSDGEAEDEGEKESFDRRRAEERMNTKHRESKWAKSLKATNRTVWDEGARESIHEQARRQEELRRRIAGDDLMDDREGSDVPLADDDNSEDHDDDEDRLKRHHLDKLKQSGESAGPERGLRGMKFMRAAEERKRARNDEDIERLRKEIAVEDGDEVESEQQSGDDTGEGLGRAVFGPKTNESSAWVTATKRPELEEGEASESDGTHGEADEARFSPAKEKMKQESRSMKSILKKPSTASRPLAKTLPPDRRDPEAVEQQGGDAGLSWIRASMPSKKSKWDKRVKRWADDDNVLDLATPLTMADKDGKDMKLSNRLHNRPTGHDGTMAAKTNGWTTVKYQNATQGDEASHAESASSSNKSRDQSAANDNTKATKTDGWTTMTYQNSDQHDEDSDVESTEENPVLTASQQRADYQRRAFAGEDVQATFDAEKAEAAASEDEKEISTHLPGWGSWTGAGLSKSIRKSNNRQRHNPLYRTKLPGGVKPAERKDRDLENVIVSEKRDRKGKVYLASQLPHEFETKQQYERSLRVPVGPEWTTKMVFQRSTRPRVVVKPGRVVEAMERPLL